MRDLPALHPTRALLILAISASLSACQYLPRLGASADDSATEAPPPLRPTYERMAGEGARVLQADPANSSVRIHAFRGGRAARVGHNHVLEARSFEGYVALRERPDQTRFEVRAMLDEMVIDDPATRADIGGAFAKPLDDDDIRGTRENLFSHVLDARTHPQVRLRSLEVGGDWPMLLVKLELTLQGIAQKHEVPMLVEIDDNGLRARGRLAVRHSQHGLTPLSVLGGLLTVQDALVLDFDIRATNLDRP